MSAIPKKFTKIEIVQEYGHAPLWDQEKQFDDGGKMRPKIS